MRENEKIGILDAIGAMTEAGIGIEDQQDGILDSKSTIGVPVRTEKEILLMIELGAQGGIVMRIMEAVAAVGWAVVAEKRREARALRQRRKNPPQTSLILYLYWRGKDG